MEKEIKIKTPYGVKNWTFVKRCFDNEVKNERVRPLLVNALKYLSHPDVLAVTNSMAIPGQVLCNSIKEFLLTD